METINLNSSSSTKDSSISWFNSLGQISSIGILAFFISVTGIGFCIELYKDYVSPFKNDTKKGLIYMFDKIKPVFKDKNVDYYLKLITSVPKNIKIKIIMSTNGGSADACSILLNALKKHDAGYDLYVYDYAMSAGAILALGADTIIMNNYSYLTKIDSSYNNIPCFNAEALLAIIKKDTKCKIEFSELNDLYQARKITIGELEDVKKLFKDPQVLINVKKRFIHHKTTHSNPIFYDTCLETGINVRKPVNEELKYFKY